MRKLRHHLERLHVYVAALRRGAEVTSGAQNRKRR
jgi:hypothetical protein